MALTPYYPTGCDTAFPEPFCSNCVVTELGRVRGAAFIRSDFVFTDITNPAQWLAGIAAQQIFIIPQTNGSFDGGTAKTDKGFGNVHLRYISSTYKLDFNDPNYIANCAFYDEMKKSSNWLPAFITETQVHLADAPAVAVPKAPVQDDDTSEVIWNVSCEWVSKNYPCPSDIPAGIFVCVGYTGS